MKHAKWISALVLVAMPLIAAAQMTPTERLVTQVPFKFMVGAVEMPAGEYVVQLPGEKGAVLTIRDPETKRSVYVLTVANLGKKSENAALVFHRYGDRYFLTELRIEDSRTVYTLQPTKLEKEFRAQNLPVAEDILLAASK
jgi:hypothetical protein